MRFRSKLSRAQLMEKYDILNQIEMDKKVEIVKEKEKSNIDLFIDDCQCIIKSGERLQRNARKLREIDQTHLATKKWFAKQVSRRECSFIGTSMHEIPEEQQSLRSFAPAPQGTDPDQWRKFQLFNKWQGTLKKTTF
ncbi:unnamed protein product [Oikopleura dioica]|uniref:Uncharacterized protein n=1 Tax=Oikopleura dioica TaxID=34765 RepID=E4XSM6_OIKDI|nr:unnamed protein product [Oikopleura dioica]